MFLCACGSTVERIKEKVKLWAHIGEFCTIILFMQYFHLLFLFVLFVFSFRGSGRRHLGLRAAVSLITLDREDVLYALENSSVPLITGREQKHLV